MLYYNNLQNNIFYMFFFLFFQTKSPPDFHKLFPIFALAKS